MAYELMVNGASRTVDVPGDTPLLWVLREELGILGPKFGCGIASCGACTVHLDGVPIRSCQTYVEDVGSSAVTTIEGLSGKAAEAVQAAWKEVEVAQCGYCQSGQIMAATALLNETPKPSQEDIEAAMDGNVCRCASYHRIKIAVNRAAEMMEG